MGHFGFAIMVFWFVPHGKQLNSFIIFLDYVVIEFGIQYIHITVPEKYRETTYNIGFELLITNSTAKFGLSKKIYEKNSTHHVEYCPIAVLQMNGAIANVA
jgi:hypothetical protein